MNIRNYFVAMRRDGELDLYYNDREFLRVSWDQKNYYYDIPYFLSEKEIDEMVAEVFDGKYTIRYPSPVRETA